MQGAGNDFVVFDSRENAIDPSSLDLKTIADRRFGVGCDQIIFVENSNNADCFMRIFNADGSQVSACGNATRCIGKMLMSEGRTQAKIETKAGILLAEKDGENIRINMGAPIFDWQKIPLARDVNIENLPVEEGNLKNPFAVSMGNPHMVFFVDSIDESQVNEMGAKLEHHELYPERANIGFACVKNKNEIDLAVFERGAGQTLACGTGACAAVVSGIRKNLLDESVQVNVKGGKLKIEWAKGAADVFMSGPAEEVFSGTIEL